MALQSTYKQFLTAPNSSFLAPDASLHYITTTTSFSGPTEIIKHLGSLRKQLNKKKEDFLSAVEGNNAIAVEVHTSIEFLTGGGIYLPALDDNFLADRTVHFPVVHIVTFDASGQILQIRQSWDQGSLLKQLEIIGKSGRNWPIRDSQDQIKLITKCLKVSGVDSVNNPREESARIRANSNNAMRDPHSSLSLFAPREEVDKDLSSFISPRAGSRPRQRSFTEILGDEPSEEIGSPSAGRDRSQSPSKAVAPKIGAGKNYQPSRLFEAEEEAEEETVSTEKLHEPERSFYRPNPKKFTHFEFGDEPHHAADPAGDHYSKSKHGSNWSFDDFTTPQKPQPSKLHRHQDVRHWGTENDQVEETPARKPNQVKPRRDAEKHFELQDDGTPQGDRRPVGKPRGTAHNTGLGLYQNNMYDEEGNNGSGASAPAALGNITNLKDRRKDFDAHFSMSDDSPTTTSQSQPTISQDRKKAVKMMDSNWSAYDESPAYQKENKLTGPKSTSAGDDRGIHIGGDGMGGPKGTNRNWLFGDDEETTTKSVPGRKPGTTAAKNGGNFWDF